MSASGLDVSVNARLVDFGGQKTERWREQLRIVLVVTANHLATKERD